MNEKKQESSSSLSLINQEINRELDNPEVNRALLATTFKGLKIEVMKQAIMEGMIRGFTFKNFLEKDVYATPFGGGYSLITSIDFSRKIGMRSGIVGKDVPVYTEDDKGNIVTCSVTIKRKINDYIGDFTSLVYFKEYTTGRNLWVTKPRTMIAKVAEMHALRMACPEELAKNYIEEELTENTKMDGLVESSNLTMGNFKKNEKTNQEQVEDEERDSGVVEGEIIE